MSEEVIIDWSAALEAVGNDREFLSEVLMDLMTEASTTITEITSAIATKDFDAVMRSAHRLKGSASYLHCNAVKESAFRLQKMGQGGKTEADLEAIKLEFNNLCRFIAATELERQNMQ
jgi:HPt (histidine-containing phosphotransfer) domain-containing protein